MSGCTEKVAVYKAVKAFTRNQVSHNPALRFSRLQSSEKINTFLLSYDSFSSSLSKLTLWGGAIPTIIRNVLEVALGLGRYEKHLEMHVRKSLNKRELIATANIDVIFFNEKEEGHGVMKRLRFLL